MEQKKYLFKLLVDLGINKKGKTQYKKEEIFDCYGGLIYGICTNDGKKYNFIDKQYFKLCT